MNLLELIQLTADNHAEFRELFEANLDEQLQQFVIHNQAGSEYEACTEVLTTILTDSIGSLTETWLSQ